MSSFLHLKVKHTGDARGFGLYATDTIHEDQLIVDYLGELISFAEKVKCYNSSMLNTYQISYSGKQLYIDAEFFENESRFANHSCLPKRKIKKWWVDGEKHLTLFATKEINDGDKIT